MAYVEPMCEICEYAIFFSFMDTGKDICGGCRRVELEKNGP